MVDAAEEFQDLTPAQKQFGLFLAKIAIAAVSTVIVFFACTMIAITLVTSLIDDRLQTLKGGPKFWELMENKLNKFADQPDIPEVKKKQIVESLRKISKKYRPFIEALDDPK